MSVQGPLFDKMELRPSKAAAGVKEAVGSRFDVKKFVENFDVLAEAGGGVRLLRGFVLDLATRGQLVAQLPAEGSAAELLAKLSRVATTGTDRRDPVAPFDLPPSWCWTTIGDVCPYIQRGKSPKYVESSSVPVVSQKCVQWEGFLIDRARFIDPASLADYAQERFLRSGDLLWNSTGHGTVGRVAVFEKDKRYPQVVADSHVTVVRPAIDPRYLWCWIASPTVQATINDLVSGTTKQTELATSIVISHALPLPPLAEQKRIVTKVDQLVALCDELEVRQTKKREVGTGVTKSALDALTTAEGPEEFDAAWKRVAENFDVLIDRAEKVVGLRGAILSLALRGVLCPAGAGRDALRDMNGRPREVVPEGQRPHVLPKHWAWLYLDQVFGSVTDGDHQPPPKAATGVPFLTIGNVSSGRLDFTETRFVSRGYFDGLDARRVPTKGDILYTVVGATYGRPVRVADRREFCVQRHIAILRPDGSCNPDYLYIFLRSPDAYRQATAAITGTAQPTVPLRPLRRFKVPVPPREEQLAIVAKVERLMKVCEDLEAKLRRTEDRAAKLVEAVVNQMVE